MKEYRTQDIVIYWDPDRCTHSANCINGLPGVFDLAKRPWVNVAGAAPEEIIRIIDTCPSGALQYSLPQGSSVDSSLAQGPGSRQHQGENEPSSPPATIKVMPNGPLMVDGNFLLIQVDGSTTTQTGKTVLCRCGHSQKRPFCDGSHFQKGWKVDA